MRKILQTYFSEKGSALDLAVFRIILFLYALQAFDAPRSLRYSGLPPEMMFPPVGTGFLLSWFQPTPELTRWVIPFFLACCGLAAVGLFTRATALGAALGAVYLWGVPELYGKVDHARHHLVWFMLILAVSPCADALSLDAFRKLRKGKSRSWLWGSGDSPAYAGPLRWIWLLFGVIYFFPGLWKAFSGWDWVLSDNLKHILHNHWFDKGGWLPVFRIDLHPGLFRAAAGLVVLFEWSFMALILFPRTRLWAAAGGLAFHLATAAIMGIPFQGLQVCYLAFVPWSRLLRRAGRRIAPSLRLPPQEGGAASAAPALKWMGILLVAVNSGLGAGRVMAAWPFACYPTFHEVQRESRSDRAVLCGVTDEGEEPLDLYGTLQGRMEAYKVTGFMRRCFAAPETVKREKLEGLWKLLKEEGMDGSRYSSLRFYRGIHRAEPDDRFGRLEGRELIAQIPLGTGSLEEGS